MDQLNKLQKEVEDLQSALNKKQEELNRMRDELGIPLHSTEPSSKSSVTSRTPNTQISENNVFAKSQENVVYTNTQTNQSVKCDAFTNIQINQSTVISDNNEISVNNGSWPAQVNTNVTKKETVNVTGAKVQIGNTLPKWAIERYSRQILLPDIGVSGQERLCTARVLIVGAGGLGCPAGVYLAGAGIGEIGIVDYDTVDLTNIHRQFLHEEKDQFISKAESAANSLRSINSRIKVTSYNVQLNSQNALQIASQYDIVLDCTDNVPTRYLLNDMCVLTKLPLVSGSALKMEGQLTMYGYRASSNPNEKDGSYIGPCYRCVFPAPPPAAAVGSCSANGVAGPVPGTIGALQALEVIKYIVGAPHARLLVERMLLFDGDDVTFRTVKLRPRNPSCRVCSDSPSIDRLIDYELFCKAQAKEKDLELDILPAEYRISPQELSKLIATDREQRHLLVDVRNEAEFRMCRLDGSVNYPIDSLLGDSLKTLLEKIRKGRNTVFICRRGNDSQVAAQKVLEAIEDEHRAKVKDLLGGLHAWSVYVDEDFPIY